MFTEQELKNIAVLIQTAQITGSQATTVAILLQKIEGELGKLMGEESAEEPKKKNGGKN